jgi:peptide deformylase
MSTLKVLEIPDPHLRLIAEPVEVVDDAIRKIAADMLETMYADNGAGLAAIQVNIQKQIIVMDVSDAGNTPLVFINPEILEHGELRDAKEGCLSVPEFYETVPRYSWVKVRALNEKGEFFEMEGKDLFAQCVHHETDHLKGILFIDYLSAFKRNRIVEKLEKLAKKKLKHKPL